MNAQNLDENNPGIKIPSIPLYWLKIYLVFFIWREAGGGIIDDSFLQELSTSWYLTVVLFNKYTMNGVK